MVGGGDQQSLAESVMVGGGPAEPSRECDGGRGTGRECD